MIVSENWRDFEVLDASDKEKLERWGDYLLIRPDPQVIWNTPKDKRLWGRHNARYHRSSKGGGHWDIVDLPEEWTISYPLAIGRDISFKLKPFAFKHTGVFPEQAANWDRVSLAIRGAGRPISVLNLFAYTGGATLACAAAGASVTHVDASKGMVGWAKENAAISGLSEAPIRWLVDDCAKFVARELRRGRHYDAIILDPPSYGRGPKGEIWKIEQTIYPLLCDLSLLLSEEPLFILINSYTTGLQPAVLTYLLASSTDTESSLISSDEIGLPVRESSLVLPCGASGFLSFSG